MLFLLVPLSLMSVCGCTQLKFGANDTGRIFNWHPVRATVCFCSFCVKHLLLTV